MPDAPLRILIVDDDADFARLMAMRLRRSLGADAVDVETAASGEALVERLDAGERPDLVVLDVVMPGMGGPAALRQAIARVPDLHVVMASAQAAVRVAVDTLADGARDYLVKGDNALDRLTAVVRQAAERRALRGEIAALRERLGDAPTSEILGESEPVRRMLALVAKAVRGDLPVLVTGESGAGKELVARAVHDGSARARARPNHPSGGAFVVLNCAAIPRELMESELFGHEKGAFTGAVAQHDGVFAQADGGTLFLDEIGELAPDLQAKLLRVLQDGQVRRVGGAETRAVDVRVVSATHRDIPAMVADGAFRQDLYYRLAGFPIAVPPLRARGTDALLLADHFLRATVARHPDLEARFLSPAARRTILAAAWPGNVRELKTAVERGALVAEGVAIAPADLMLPDAQRTAAERATAATSPDEIVPMEALKRAALEHAWAVCGGDAQRTADALGITRSTVYRLVKAYGLPTGARAEAQADASETG